MTRLPQVSGRQVVKALEKVGYRTVRQKGSHIRLINDARSLLPISVPDHRIIGKGLLHKILRDAGLSADEFRKLL